MTGSSHRLSRLADPVRSLFERYEEDHEQSIDEPKVARWEKYEIHFPEDHPSDHDASWTGADGVWYCRTCNEWYRTWEENPSRPERQEAGW